MPIRRRKIDQIDRISTRSSGIRVGSSYGIASAGVRPYLLEIILVQRHADVVDPRRFVPELADIAADRERDGAEAMLARHARGNLAIGDRWEDADERLVLGAAALNAAREREAGGELGVAIELQPTARHDADALVILDRLIGVARDNTLGDQRQRISAVLDRGDRHARGEQQRSIIDRRVRQRVDIAVVARACFDRGIDPERTERDPDRGIARPGAPDHRVARRHHRSGGANAGLGHGRRRCGHAAAQHRQADPNNVTPQMTIPPGRHARIATKPVFDGPAIPLSDAAS
ncbi:hypothetical protein LLW23_02970 [Sphingomonas radiodurans]|nr:hypothetical protein [Sphingomonas radiodurans]WBH17098.1 hypothetical protein LLW23_02970 [Sphingomonas radiodurans]